MSCSVLVGLCVALLATAGCSAIFSKAGPTTSAPPTAPAVLARTDVTSARGAKLAADGVALMVPAGAVTGSGVATITAETDGTYDISLTAPWTGTLQVTIPLTHADDVVMHEVDGVWFPEGSKPGQSTVPVTHLSPFAPSSLLSKLGDALCIKQGVPNILGCLAGKGVETIDKHVLEALLGQATSPCEAKILSQVDGASLAGSVVTAGGLVLVKALAATLSNACTGHAGDPSHWTIPAATPTIPVAAGGPPAGGPIQGGGSQAIQGSTPNLQGSTGTSTPQSTPAQAPVPAGAGRIMISPCLNLRSGPNGNTTLIGCVPKDTIIAIDCTAAGDSVTGPYGATTLWDHTTYQNTAGYVSDAWVYTGHAAAVAGACGATAAPAPAPAPAPGGTKPTGRIMISPCLNLRSGPNGNTALIGCIPDSTTISIDCTAQGNSVTGPYGATTLWDRTTYQGAVGYVSDAYVYTGQAAAVAGPC
jgi:uncharacterized protein YraI